jgi:hypothetical protein
MQSWFIDLLKNKKNKRFCDEWKQKEAKKNKKSKKK